MDERAFALELERLFPEKAGAMVKNERDYDGLLIHVYFSDEIVLPLRELLKKGREDTEIRKYCEFIEKMWKEGTSEVREVVDITILEELSDERSVWERLGAYLGDDFIAYINGGLLSWNRMMDGVPPLERKGFGG